MQISGTEREREKGEDVTFFTKILFIFFFCFSGEKDTLTHGSVVDGRFEGFIKTHQGTYYVEPSERYLKEKNVDFHSVIYHEDDISKYLSNYSIITLALLKRYVWSRAEVPSLFCTISSPPPLMF